MTWHHMLKANSMEPKPDKRILVVEDEPGWQRLIGDLVQEVGSANDWTMQVVIVSRFVEALDHITQASFDCVTMDRQLQDGTMANPLLDRVGRLIPPVPVVMISGTANPSDVRDYFKDYSVEEFFWKEDFDAKKFRQKLTELLARRVELRTEHLPRSINRHHPNHIISPGSTFPTYIFIPPSTKLTLS